MNGVGIIGRLLPTYLADRFGTLTVFVPVCGSSALLMFCWTAVSTESGLFGWAAICGTVLGGIQSMFPAALASLTTDPSKQGTRIGMVFTIVSFSVLTGTPIAGVLITALDGRYLGAQLFSGCSLAMGALLLIAAREFKRRKLNVQLLGKV
jgi:MFS family permease